MEISKIYVKAKEEKNNERNKTRAERCKWGRGGIESLDHVVRADFCLVPPVESPKTAQNTNLLPFKTHLIYHLGRERRTPAV